MTDGDVAVTVETTMAPEGAIVVFAVLLRLCLRLRCVLTARLSGPAQVRPPRRLPHQSHARAQATESTIAFSVALGRIALLVSSTFGR
ncbi:hypothetical protein OKW46_005964 [Paraburkholderia sp. WSM4179]|nr:hypothetical protein [Paraburkholderia sp. WSM4179]